MQNQLVVDSDDEDDAGVPDIRYRRLGRGRHPVAAGRDSFAVAYLETGSASELYVAIFDKWGRRNRSPHDMSTNADITSAADPVIAALPNSRFALAWSDRSNGTLDIAVRLIAPEQETQPIPITANTTLSGPQQDPDIVWTGQELVVAWSDNFNLKYRTFSEQLLALESERTLAETSAVEGLVTLERFANSWAAAWRVGEAGMERLEVRAGDISWQTETFPPGPQGDHPALVALDDEHLLLVFTQGTDPLELGVFNVGRIRMALLDVASPGLIESIPLVAMTSPFDSDETLAQQRPTAVKVGERIYIAWETESPLGDPLRSELWVQQVSISYGSPDTVNQLEECALPVTAPRSGDQENPVLAGSNLYPEGALISVWEDKSGAYGDWPSPELVLGFRPSPFVDLPLNIGHN